MSLSIVIRNNYFLVKNIWVPYPKKSAFLENIKKCKSLLENILRVIVMHSVKLNGARN